MDSVKFGRALGMGARNAAKALAMAADAAASPSPQKPCGAGTTARGGDASLSSRQKAEHVAAKTAANVRQASGGLARGSKRFGEAAWGPFVRLSGVLWLELVGVFFGLFLLTAGVSAWKLRAHLHDTGLNHADHLRFLWSVAMALVFGYFCVSSFVRASRRERRR